MSILKAHIKNNKSGEVRIYMQDDSDYPEGAKYTDDGVEFMFSEGNHSCDCNRHDFFEEAGEDSVEVEDYPCGHNRYSVIKLMLDDKEIEFTDFYHYNSYYNEEYKAENA